MQGVFIAFEGIDGSGKSSAARAITDQLRSEGRDILLTREPGGTSAGKRIRSLILQLDHRLTPEAELLLMSADRAEHVATVIRPALEQGVIVLSDRYAASTRAYQGYGLGLPESIVDAAITIATDGLCPDLTVLFDLDPETAHARRSGDSLNVNSFDVRDLSFRTRVRDGYLDLARKSNTWHVIDASLPLDLVIARAGECVRTVVGARQTAQ